VWTDEKFAHLLSQTQLFVNIHSALLALDSCTSG